MDRQIIRPATEEALCAVVAEAAARGCKLAIRSGGSKDAIGAPTEARILDMSGFAGVIDYDPAELVLTAGVGTPLAEILATVAGEGQMLAFDPFDHGAILGLAGDAATIGGVIAAGVAGPLRLTRGGARDHLLGCHAVSGRGEVFVGGGTVVKNVTGYDLPKLMAGSWGRLAAMTRVSIKVLPRARVRATRLIEGLDVATATAAMARALGSQAEVSAAAHIAAHPGRGGRPVTAFRVPGFAASVEARCGMLDRLLAEFGPLDRLDDAACEAFWNDVAVAAPFRGRGMLWRINVALRRAPIVVAAIEALGGACLLDWGGGLIWAAVEADAEEVRKIAAGQSGHAMLVRAPEDVRRVVPAFHPPAPGVAALEARVRRAFDPAGVFETGRFAS